MAAGVGGWFVVGGEDGAKGGDRKVSVSYPRWNCCSCSASTDSVKFIYGPYIKKK